MKNYLNVFMVVLVSLAVLGTSLAVSAADVPRMSKEELKSMLDNKDVVVVDVRKGRDWTSSESKIKGAVREEAYQAASWASKYDKNKTYVLYCA